MRNIELAADLTAPVITLGCGPFGSAIPTTTADALLDAYVEGGGWLLDTAHCYAGWLPGGDGASERCLGTWLRARGCADRILVATKGAHHRFDGKAEPRVRPECIDQDIAESLERLGLASVALYSLHRDDESVGVDELLDCLEAHRRAGRCRAYGASNWSPQRMAAARAWADERGIPGFVANQIGWSLARRATPVGDGMRWCSDADLAWHRTSGCALFAFSSQAKGTITKLLDGRGAPGAFDHPANPAIAERCETIGRELGAEPEAVALAWMTGLRGLAASAVIGPRDIDQLRASMVAGDLVLDAEQRAALDALVKCSLEGTGDRPRVLGTGDVEKWREREAGS